MRPNSQSSPVSLRHAVALGILIVAFLAGFINGVRRGIADGSRMERLVLPAVVSPMEPSR